MGFPRQTTEVASHFPLWQIAEEAEKTLPSVDYFREKLGLLPEEIIPYGKTPKLDFIRIKIGRAHV